MPRYDYQCKSCGQEFELTQSFSEAGIGTCPECSGEGRRVFHAVPVIYKGSGFYTTDYGRAKAPADDKAAAEDKSKEKTKENKDTSDSKSSGKPSDNGAGNTSKSESAPKATSETGT